MRRTTLLTAMLALSCDSGETTGGAAPAAEDPARVQALRALANEVFLPTYRDFHAAADALETATRAWQADPAARGDAQDAFITAMLVWQQAEVMQVGPAAPVGRPGGLGLRDEIYSWPTVNPCRVDQALIAQDYAAADFPSGKLVNVYGLDTLEYLLFHPGANACPAQVPLNAQGTWDAAEDLPQRQADYAVAVAEQVARDAARLVELWAPEGEDFAARLSGDKDGAYPTAQAALDDVFAGLFYVDLQLKDAKLAEPAGLGLDCSEDRCPDRVESRWARRSSNYADANLTGLERVLEVGFYDLLQSTPDLVSNLDRGVTDAHQAVQAMVPTMADSLAADPGAARTAHAAVKFVTDLLKTQFVTVLNLSLPQEGAADND